MRVGIVRVGLDPRPQAADEGRDDPRVTEVVEAPDPLEQLVAADDPARVLEELA